MNKSKYYKEKECFFCAFHFVDFCTLYTSLAICFIGFVWAVFALISNIKIEQSTPFYKIDMSSINTIRTILGFLFLTIPIFHITTFFQSKCVKTIKYVLGIILIFGFFTVSIGIMNENKSITYSRYDETTKNIRKQLESEKGCCYPYQRRQDKSTLLITSLLIAKDCLFVENKTVSVLESTCKKFDAVDICAVQQDQWYSNNICPTEIPQNVTQLKRGLTFLTICSIIAVICLLLGPFNFVDKKRINYFLNRFLSSCSRNYNSLNNNTIKTNENDNNDNEIEVELGEQIEEDTKDYLKNKKSFTEMNRCECIVGICAKLE